MDNQDPKDTRFLQTRDGVAQVPRAQQGVPLKEFFRNAELPENLDTAVVYATEKGPVLASPDPIEFGPQHQDQAQGFAEKLRTQIDERGYYSGSLKRYAGQLADETGQKREEMKALISAKFEQAYGQDPYGYLQDSRERRGLPVRDREPGLDQGPDRKISPEMG